jgi:hypothetical protein
VGRERDCLSADSGQLCGTSWNGPGDADLHVLERSGACSLQVASWDEGVLGTKTVVLGGPAEEYPGYLMFKLEIVEDEETGEYRVVLKD